MIKLIINRTIWVLVFILTIVFVIWANIENANMHCSDVEIHLKQTDYPTLTSKETIKTDVLKSMPALIGQSVKNIELQKLEEHVAINTRLSSVKAFLNLNGLISIKVSPRKAILRIFDEKGQNLYLGNEKVLMNNTSEHTQRILVASGHIKHLTANERKMIISDGSQLPEIYSELYEMANIIHADEFLDALIDQIYVKKNQELILTPKIGVKKIYFGNAENTAEKLSNLKAFYVNGVQKIDWQKYQSINIKFRNQIVCSKK